MAGTGGNIGGVTGSDSGDGRRGQGRIVMDVSKIKFSLGGEKVRVQLSDILLIKGQNIVSLCPMYRVWNTITRLCAYHWDTEAHGEEEEEEEDDIQV